MNANRSIFLFCAVLVLVSGAGSQGIKQVSGEEAIQHLTKRVAPTYPSMAELARIQGDVLVRAVIDENGKVTEVKGVTGHPMLLEAAIPAVKAWKFEPFTEDGKTMAVQTLLKVAFILGPGAKLHGQYLEQELECTQQIRHNSGASAEAACKKALVTSTKLPRDFVSDKIKAFDNVGKAANGAKDGSEALETFQQQLNFAQQALPPGSPLMIQVRNNLAHAYETSGKLPEADSEYTEAEKAQEASLAELEKRRETVRPVDFDAAKSSFEHNMQIILQAHAGLLRKMGKAAEADAMEQKARSVSESR